MIEIPIKIESTLNKREHWRTKAARAKKQRAAACTWLGWEFGLPINKPLPTVVRLTRIAPRELDDDNLAGGFKSVRDGIADWLGIDDRDPRVKWRYGQIKGKPKEYAVRVSFESVEDAVAAISG